MRIRIRFFHSFENPGPSFLVKAKNLDKCPVYSIHLAYHLQIDADTDLDRDPAYHFVADPDPKFI
jgi:hypothetical protein